MAEAPEQSIVEANIRLLMKRRGIGGIQGLRQAMAAVGLKIGVGTIQRALQGGDTNRMESLSKFAQFFDVTTDQLLQPDLGGSEPAERGPTGDVYEEMTPAERQMLANYRKLLDKDRKAIDSEIAAKAEERQAEADELFARFGVAKAVERAHARRARGDVSSVDITDVLRQNDLFDEGGKPKP